MISPARAKKISGWSVIQLFILTNVFQKRPHWNSLCLPRWEAPTCSPCPSLLPAPLSPVTHDHIQCFHVEWILQREGQWHFFLMLFHLTNSFHWLPVPDFRPSLNEDFFGFLIPSCNCTMSVNGMFLTSSSEHSIQMQEVCFPITRQRCSNRKA